MIAKCAKNKQQFSDESNWFTCATCGEKLPMTKYDHRFDRTDQDECQECGQRILDEEEQ